ncbi:hypothetical protein DV515_00004882 [Chloebia gouldiae]|uniref:Immediate early response 3-interacting protein 1 n=1 Tax=Chloebia gouldiae TaxID=44316 RepID=A0A3L8SPS4_CHLGU|nr:hypothetical protein DV515_00004882 [Chloebia gouldiae]
MEAVVLGLRLFLVLTTAVCNLSVLQDEVGVRQAGSHSTRLHNHGSQTPLLVLLLLLSSIICRLNVLLVEG